jgi:hypothetical protein
MPTVVASGTVEIKTLGKEYGIESVPVPTMKARDQILLTPYIGQEYRARTERGPSIVHSSTRRRTPALKFWSTTFRAENST